MLITRILHRNVAQGHLAHTDVPLLENHNSTSEYRSRFSHQDPAQEFLHQYLAHSYVIYRGT